MFPISITDGHVALLIEHNDHIYIADSWISYLSNKSNKIKPYFGDLDSYVDYIYTNFAGKEKSTWLAKTYGGVDSSIVVKETILNTLDGLKDFKGNLGSVFAAKGIQLDSVDQFKIINDYLDRLRLMSPSIQTKY